MTPETPQLLQILKKACQLYGYSWELVDTYANNLVEISDGQKSFFSSNSKIGTYPLNPKFSAQLVNDKAWSYKILKKKGYEVPRGDYFFLRDDYREMRGEGKELKDAITFAKDKYPVFVKPNSSSLGILAEVIHDEAELKLHLEQIAEIGWITLVQEVIEQPEFRIFAVDGEVEFVYQRSAPVIMGDGEASVGEMIKKMNQNIKRERNKILETSPFLKRQMEKYDLDFSSVLEVGQTLKVTSKANISAGGAIQNYSEEVSDETKLWVKTLMKDLSLRVSGIDVFVETSINEPNGFTIIEINHNPNLSGIYNLGHKEKVMTIWGKILSAYFG